MDFESINQNGNSKERRDQLKKVIEELEKDLPFKFEKTSQLRILKAICTFIKKEKHFRDFKKIANVSNLKDLKISYNDDNVDQICSGFITCFSKTGDLIYLSENISDYFGFNAMDVLFAYDSVLEIVCKQDAVIYTDLFKNYQQYVYPKRFDFYSSWHVSKIQKKHISIGEYKQFKISGHYDPLTELFIASCEPVLSMNNRDALTKISPSCFKTTHKLNLQILECSAQFYECLGYNPLDVQDRFNLYNLCSPDSVETVVKRHRDLLVIKNVKGYTDRVKLIHKDGGFVDCLLNIFYDPKGFIVCIHQMFSKQDMENYVLYMSKLDQKEDKGIKIEINEEPQISNISFENTDKQFANVKIENSFENDFLELSQANFGSVKHKYDYFGVEEEIQFDFKKTKFSNDCSKEQNFECFSNGLSDIQDILKIEETLKETVFQNQIKCQQKVEYPSIHENFNLQSQYLNQELDNDLNYEINFYDFEDKVLERRELEDFSKYGYNNECNKKYFVVGNIFSENIDYNDFQEFYPDNIELNNFQEFYTENISIS